MALRLIELVLREKDGGDVRGLLKEHKVLEHRQVQLPDGEVLVQITEGRNMNVQRLIDTASRLIADDKRLLAIIVPSLLACNQARFGQEAERAGRSGTTGFTSTSWMATSSRTFPSVRKSSKPSAHSPNCFSTFILCAPGQKSCSNRLQEPVPTK